ncbi:MAG: MarR family winged helix-turn-helix transcriptional regulator [Hyphomicrobium sp.]
MERLWGNVKVQNTRNVDRLGGALLDLIGFLNSPRRDEALLSEAGVSLDRALFPLLVALGARGRLAIAELADLVGRDHTTVSRQIAKLESLDLVDRCETETDRRRREAQLTEEGARIVRAIGAARRRLLSSVLADWSETDRSALADNLGRFVDALISFAQKRR